MTVPLCRMRQLLAMQMGGLIKPTALPSGPPNLKTSPRTMIVRKRCAQEVKSLCWKRLELSGHVCSSVLRRCLCLGDRDDEMMMISCTQKHEISLGRLAAKHPNVKKTRENESLMLQVYGIMFILDIPRAMPNRAISSLACTSLL